MAVRPLTGGWFGGISTASSVYSAATALASLARLAFTYASATCLMAASPVPCAATTAVPLLPCVPATTIPTSAHPASAQVLMIRLLSERGAHCHSKTGTRQWLSKLIRYRVDTD